MTKKKTSYGFATRAIHAGAAPEAITGARNIPIYQNWGAHRCPKYGCAYFFNSHSRRLLRKIPRTSNFKNWYY